MANQLLIDTSFLYALYNQGDTDHQAALQFALHNQAKSFVPVVVLPEVHFLFLRDTGHPAAIKFLEEFTQTGFELEMVTREDLIRTREIMVSYKKAELDLVDCCIMALAERLNVTRICTFDRRDFSIFRPTHCDFLELLP